MKKFDWKTLKRFGKPSVPLALCAAGSVVRCYAGTSPMSQLFTDLSNEATTTWAVTGAGLGLVIGFLGIKFGGHEMKGKMVALVIGCFCLLSVQAIITYLQSE